MRLVLLRLLVCATLTFVATFLANLAEAQAPTNRPRLQSTIEEGYSTQVVTAGGVLVGLMRGASLPATLVSSYQVRIRASASPTTVCLSAGSRDGEWWARGAVVAPAQTSGSLAFQQMRTWRYEEQLAQYQPGDVAAIARVGSDCATSRSAPLAPVIAGSDPTALVAMINSQNALSVNAIIALADGKTLAGVCSRLTARSLHFDHRCSFRLPDGLNAGAAQLILNRLPAVGPQLTNQFTVQLGWR